MAVCRRGPRADKDEGSPRVMLSGLNSTALVLAVYASQEPLRATTQDSLPAAGWALPGEIGYSRDDDERFQRSALFSPFPELVLAQCQFIIDIPLSIMN